MLTLFVVVFIGAIACAVAYRLRKEQGLRAAGSNIKRDYDAIRTAHIYSSPIIGASEFWDAITPSSLNETGAEAQLLERGAIRFVSQSYGYEAIMDQLADEEDEHRLRFSFVSWRGRSGGIEYATQMQVLLTSVEKALLALDPFVTVRHERMATKHRTKFI